MRILNFVKQTKVVIIIVAVVLMISAGAIYKFKFNLGIDFATATVVQIQLDHDETVAKVKTEADKFATTSAVEKEGSSKFSLYFQNISLDALKDLSTNLGNGLPGIVSKKAYSYEPVRPSYIKARVTGFSAVAVLTGIAFLIITFRKKGYNRAQVLRYVLAQLMVIGFEAVVLAGTLSISGKLGLHLDEWLVSTIVLCEGLLIVIKLFSLMRFFDYSQAHSQGNLVTDLVEYYQKDWPATTLLVTLMGVVIILPFAVFGLPYSLGAVFLLVSIVLGLFTSGVLLEKVISGLEALSDKSKRLRKNKFLGQQW